ncbi:MAG: L,D-transpeptidase [Bacillota bacterium]|nr:L,D-transpeptidase [Bacillota bacterium]
MIKKMGLILATALIFQIIAGFSIMRLSKIHHKHSVNPDISLDSIIKTKGIKDTNNFNLYIDLSRRLLYFKYKDKSLKQYVIAAGIKTNSGDKHIEGDCRTPRGEFYICQKAIHAPPRSDSGSRWMLLSYPNIEDAARGLKNRLINKYTYGKIKNAIENKKVPPQNTKLGGLVGIHGGARPDYLADWTGGCIGMYDKDAEEIYKYLKCGSKVVIR